MFVLLRGSDGGFFGELTVPPPPTHTPSSPHITQGFAVDCTFSPELYTVSAVTLGFLVVPWVVLGAWPVRKAAVLWSPELAGQLCDILGNILYVFSR